MQKRMLGLTIFMLLLISAVSAEWLLQTAKAEPTTLFVDDDYNSSTSGWGVNRFNKIQDAVDAAIAGDTIFVYAGVYYESVEVIEKNNLTFIAEKGGQPVKSVMIDAGGLSGFDFFDCIGAKVSGFKITNAHNGIDTSGTIAGDYCDFSGNDIENCKSFGIYVTGSHCNVAQNFLKNTDGIECAFLGHNIIGSVVARNSIYDTKPYEGIHLDEGVNCSITNNIISNASVGIILVHGINNLTCSRNMIMHNEIGDSARGIQLAEYAYPDTQPMTNNVIGHNYIHDATPYPSYGGEGIYIEHLEGREMAEYSTIYHNTIEDFNIGIKNEGNYGVIHHNEAINCVTDYVDLGTGNVDYKNSWN